MTLETGKPIAKIFLYNFPFQKDLLPLFSSELIQKFPFSETIPLFPFDHMKDSTDETTPRCTRYRTTKTTSEWRVFSMHLNNGNYNGWRPKTSRIWRLWRIPRFVWPRNATLMELGGLWKLSIPEIKVYQRKTETRSMRTQSFVKRKPQGRRYQLWNDSSWEWQEQKHGYPWCYRPLMLFVTVLS